MCVDGLGSMSRLFVGKQGSPIGTRITYHQILHYEQDYLLPT